MDNEKEILWKNYTEVQDDLWLIRNQMTKKDNIITKQIITLVILLVSGFLFHFFLIYINKSLSTNTNLEIFIDEMSTGLFLIINPILFILISGIVIKKLTNNYDVFSINATYKELNDLNMKQLALKRKEEYFNDLVFSKGIDTTNTYNNYCPEFLSNIIYKTKKIFLIVLIFLIPSLIYGSYLFVYEKFIDFIPIDYSIEKYIQTPEYKVFSNIYNEVYYDYEEDSYTVEPVDIEKLKEIISLPQKRVKSEDEMILTSSLNKLNESKRLIDMKVKKNSKNKNIIIKDKLIAENFLIIAKKIQFAWDTNNYEIYIEAVNQLEKIVNHLNDY